MGPTAAASGCYDDPPAFEHDLQNQMNMVEGITTAGPHGPQVPPGTYTMELTVDGTTYTQTVVLHNDPRVGESPATLAAVKSQHKLTQLAYQGMKDTYAANEEVALVRAQVTALLQSFIQLNNSLGTMVSMMQVGLDMAPTPAQINTWTSNCGNYNTTLASWKKLQSEDLAAFGGVKVTPTKLTPATCTFATPAAPGPKTSGGRQ